MTPFWHLTTLGCIPWPNPQGRLKEQRILRLAATDAAARSALKGPAAIRARTGESSRRLATRG